MNLAIDRGEVMFIIGTSGVGKSVTIKHLIGLLRIDAGEIWFDGQRVDQLPERALAPLRKRIGMVFQSSTLFDSMTLVLTVFGGLVMYTAGGLTAKYSFAVNPGLFFDASQVRGRHVVLLILKSVSYGAAIPVVAGFCGLRARGSSEGVGWATTAAVIGGSFAVIILDFVISAAALLLTGGDL